MSASLMPMVSCRDCRKLFMKLSRDICPECREKEQLIISQVVVFVKMHPRCDVRQISSATGISAKKINFIVHEGLLRRFGLDLFYPCRICSAAVNKGNICFWCAETLGRLIDELKGDIMADPVARQKIEDSGLRPDMNEEDWEKAASLFSDDGFRKRRDKNISGRGRRAGWCR